MLALAAFLVSHSLLDPTPQDATRPLATDRPDLTEGAYTVDAGHVQVEADFAVLGADADGGLDLSIFGVNARFGLTDAIDVHVIAPTVGAAFAAQATPTVGDLTLRMKWNLIGNNEGDLALALMPYLVVAPGFAPSAGAIAPLNLALPADFGLGAMAAVEVIRDKNAVDMDVLVSASVAHAIVGDLAGYVEGLAHGAVWSGAHEVWASTGFTWAASPDVQLDGGLRALVLGADLRGEAFAGITIRR